MKRFSVAVLAMILPAVAYASAPIANIRYIHDYIRHKWNIDVPYNPDLDNKNRAANMKYLLTAVDVANEILNGAKTTFYGVGTYATHQAANTDVTVRAVDSLVMKIGFPFWVTPETTGNTFVINIAAAGTFFIDWGDGEIQTWTKEVGQADISHTYSGAANTYTVRMGGVPTRYPTTENGAVYFGNEENRRVRSVGGCVGCLFHTIEEGTQEWHQPKFHQTFRLNEQLTSVPSGFFNGLYGGGGRRMFWNAFASSGLTDFPEDLFGTSRLEPAPEMFASFCESCARLRHIPDNLFKNISGDATDMEFIFSSTFANCGSLAAIPVDLFGVIENINKSNVFYHTFYNDRAVSGDWAPKLNGKYVWEWWPEWTNQMLYYVALNNWEGIPPGWR